MRILFAIIIGAVSATNAVAQTYVAAALGADLTKSYESATNGTAFPDGDREAIAWGLRVGTALGSRWGVELEFDRPDSVDTGNRPIIYAAPLGTTTLAAAPVPRASAPVFTDGRLLIFPPPQIETDQRNTTWNAAAWVRQPIGARADLVVLGGLGFSHVVQNTRYEIGGPSPLLAAIPIAQRSFRTRTVNYGVGPLVGMETRIRMTDHLELTPGVRVQSLGNDLAPGLLLRPSIALGWTF
jgi:hypothetical protein